MMDRTCGENERKIKNGEKKKKIGNERQLNEGK